LDSLEQITSLQHRLIKASARWAAGKNSALPESASLRREIILALHRYYLGHIAAYRQLAAREGIGESADIDDVKARLTSTDDIFKGYRQTWLNEKDFTAMNTWLSRVFYREIDIDVSGINSIDSWLEALEDAGVMVSYSSGTSGSMSFVPRAASDWSMARTANAVYLAALLVNRGVIKPPARFLLGPAVTLLSPADFKAMAVRGGLSSFDAFFLGFRGGAMGNQKLITEMAPLFGKSDFLYDIQLSASVLRSLGHGTLNQEELRQMEDFNTLVVEKREQNYLRLADAMQESAAAGRKIFVFGAPYQFNEFCHVMSANNRRVVSKRHSILLFGGGWKSFSGEAMDREQLVLSLSWTFGLPPEDIMEGYSMTEISVLMLRCQYGRFHIPPLIEPVIFDDELKPLAGAELSGTFGFLDSLAASYPGFVISGDHVHLVSEVCACGLAGPAITEIGRAERRGIKGCGGIMGSLSV
jgi:hypothetical protein